MKAKNQQVKQTLVPDPLAQLRERYPPVAMDADGGFVIFGTPH